MNKTKTVSLDHGESLPMAAPAMVVLDGTSISTPADFTYAGVEYRDIPIHSDKRIIGYRTQLYYEDTKVFTMRTTEY